VLSKARARFGSSVFEEFFRQSIELCRRAGLLAEGPVYVDSTLMRANASVDSLTRRDDVCQPPLSVAEYLRRLDEEDVEAPPPDAAPPAGRPPSAGGPLLRPNQELQSRTDPEATLVNRPDFGRHLAYKAHVAVAGRRGQVITAAVATTGAEADEHLLPEVLWHHRRLSKHAIPAAVADAKYGTTLNYLYLEHAGIPAFIPTTRFGNQHTGIWGREHFQWLPDEDAFLCPAGEHLRRVSNMPGTQRVRYQAPKGSCVACPFRAQCAPSGTERSLHRSWALDLVEAAQQRVASPLGIRRLVERKTYIEGTFGLAKELHGLRRTRFRGRQRVQIQLWLTAAAMNIKRAVRSRVRKPGPAALPRLRAWLQTSWRSATLLAPSTART
jgi:Transposase DDE domain